MVKERIKLSMQFLDAILTMGGGNPGAIEVCTELVTKGPSVDPDALPGGLFNLMMLDNLGIYEKRIYKLWSDVCGRNIGKMIAVLRAYQLGHCAGVNLNTLNHAIDNHGAGIDLDAVVDAVKKRLPKFNPEAALVA